MAVALGLAGMTAACDGDPTFQVVMADSSMEPTLTAGSVVGFRRAAQARRGDVIAFEYPFPYPGRPRRELVARVIGLPGEQLGFSRTGVEVNGERLSEPYAKNNDQLGSSVVTVPIGSYFVLGDDRNNQRDSRWWGPLPADKLLGVVDPPR